MAGVETQNCQLPRTGKITSAQKGDLSVFWAVPVFDLFFFSSVLFSKATVCVCVCMCVYVLTSYVRLFSFNRYTPSQIIWFFPFRLPYCIVFFRNGRAVPFKNKEISPVRSFPLFFVYLTHSRWPVVLFLFLVKEKENKNE